MAAASNAIYLDKATHVYTDSAGVVYPGVTSVLKSAGLVDASWYTPEAAARGTLVHDLTRQLDDDIITLDEVPWEVRGYCEAWLKFKIESLFHPVLIEQVVKHDVYRYAGCIDRAGEMGGHPYIIDIKTGTATPATAIQTSAYAACLPSPHQRAAVELHADGTYKVHTYKDARDLNIFLAALTLHSWRKNHGLI